MDPSLDDQGAGEEMAPLPHRRLRRSRGAWIAVSEIGQEGEEMVGLPTLLPNPLNSLRQLLRSTSSTLTVGDDLMNGPCVAVSRGWTTACRRSPG